MSFAEEIRQISKESLSDSEIYSRMIDSLFRSLQDMIRDKVRKTGELNGILYVYESANTCLASEIYDRTGNRKRDLFEIGLYDGSYYLNFSPFFNREETFSKRYNRVSLSNSGKKVTDDLFRLFEAEGVSVRFSEKPPLILYYEIK